MKYTNRKSAQKRLEKELGFSDFSLKIYKSDVNMNSSYQQSEQTSGYKYLKYTQQMFPIIHSLGAFVIKLQPKENHSSEKCFGDMARNDSNYLMVSKWITNATYLKRQNCKE